MKKQGKRIKKEETCPKCGESFDPQEFGVVECPRCHVEGSTKCCNPGGRSCICVKCEEGDGMTDQVEERRAHR